MKKRLGLLLFWLCCLPLWASAQSPVTGFCEKGGQVVVTNGVSSTTKVQRTYVGCTVSVFDAGSTNLSTIFSDGAGTPKANPFTADATTGYWAFYANNGSYDVSIAATGLGATTIRTVKIADASSSPLSGSGTSGRVPKWSGTSSITNSQITDNSTSVGINNTSPAASALLDLTSTTQGLLPPRLTATQRDAIASPANGLFIYNSTTGQFNGFQAGVWGAIGGSAGSGITSLNGLTGASQTFVNSSDTNVTLGIASAGVTHTFTLGWTGTLAKTRTLGTTVYTDQGNTFSAGAQDFSAASSFTVPVAGGTAPTVSGRMAYDSTSNTLEYGANGVNRTVVNLSESQTLSNKSLTAPNIGDFTGAQHSHQNTAGGGLLDVAAIGSGVFSLARGGTNTTSASYSTNGAFYYDGSKFITTAAGGAGTLCLQATDGGVPTFGACSGTAATALSALTAATTSNTLNSGDNAQIWKWTLTTSGKTGWRISENTASAAAGTPFLVAIDTLSTSTVNPFQVTAGGTANGVRVDTTGKLAKIGTGSVTADALNGLSANGWLVQTSTGNFTARTLAAGEGIGITNLDGTGGNPSFTWSPSTQVSSFSLFDGTQASRTETINLSGTDPVYTFTSNKVELTTGNFQAPLFDKGGQVFNVKAYGAVCDGSTNDAAAIQATHDAMPSTGGILFVSPSGTCAVGSTINITKPNVLILGGGRNSVLKAQNSANLARVVYFQSGANGGAIESLKLDGNAANGGSNSSSGSVIETQINDFSIRNSEVTGAGFQGLLLSSIGGTVTVNNLVVDNCYIHDNVGDGIRLYSGTGETGRPKHVRIINNTINDNHRTGANPAGSGISVNGGDQVEIIGNHLKNNYNAGAQIAIDAVATNVTINANTVETTSDSSNTSSIELGGQDHVIIGNELLGGGNGYGVAVQPGDTVDARNIIIAGNVIKGHLNGVGLLNTSGTGKVCRDIQVQGNFFGSLTTGVIIDAAGFGNITITGNDLTTSVTTPISNASNQTTNLIINNPGTTEYVTASASGVSLTSGVAKTITSVTLGLGSWDVSGLIRYNTANTYTELAVSLGTANNSFNATLGQGIDNNYTIVTGGRRENTLPTTRFDVTTASTPIYLVGFVGFSSGSATADAIITARKVK